MSAIKIFDNKSALQYIDALKKRGIQAQWNIESIVRLIIGDVKENGDASIIKYTKKFDKTDIDADCILVSDCEIENAVKSVDKEFLEALKTARDNIISYHNKQKRNSWNCSDKKGTILGQNIRPLQRVGIYVPGGTAAYPSSVLMNALPAKCAGVDEIIMVTPPSKDGTVNKNILAAASLAGVNKIYKVGGAQAIAALAYGTESIPKVDKIVGPGNIYVATAKKCVYGSVDIDMIAGPSEILIIADEGADPSFIAADIMSQAEHDVLASAILVTTSQSLAEKVQIEIEKQIASLERKDIISKSLNDYGMIITSENIDEAAEMANNISPEHIELMVKDPFILMQSIKNAGSIFLGYYSPEPLGDYMAGPNHVLPTSGTARFFSPLSVDDFIKKSSFIYYDKEALSEVSDKIVKLAEVEGLTAHANSIKVRFANDNNIKEQII